MHHIRSSKSISVESLIQMQSRVFRQSLFVNKVTKIPNIISKLKPTYLNRVSDTGIALSRQCLFFVVVCFVLWNPPLVYDTETIQDNNIIHSQSCHRGLESQIFVHCLGRSIKQWQQIWSIKKEGNFWDTIYILILFPLIINGHASNLIYCLIFLDQWILLNKLPNWLSCIINGKIIQVFLKSVMWVILYDCD
jgi:hypothetical protein